MRLLPWESKTKLKKDMAVKAAPAPIGFRFTLKGSPRHYDNVKAIVESTGTARVYFGEALAYERGAGIALWRIRATDFSWLAPLYEWWAEMEKVEPIQFTFYLYLPTDSRYPVLDLREHSPADVAAYISSKAPWDGRRPAPSPVPVES